VSDVIAIIAVVMLGLVALAGTVAPWLSRARSAQPTEQRPLGFASRAVLEGYQRATKRREEKS
jgi:hypothetical protein